MAGVNKVILVGRAGADPDVKVLSGGGEVASFSIATSERWKDKNSGEQKEKTEWHRIVAWGNLAGICKSYVTKGREVYVEGKLQTRSWEKDGVTRYTTEIVANHIELLGSRNDGAGAQAAGNSQQQQSSNPQPQQQQNNNRQPQQQQNSNRQPQQQQNNNRQQQNSNQYDYDAPPDYKDNDIPF